MTSSTLFPPALAPVALDRSALPTYWSALPTYWSASAADQLRGQGWCQDRIDDRIDLAAWQAHLADLPRDPYVNQRWKRMSWLTLTEDGAVRVMGECPMAQGGAFNDAESMADRLRYYAPLTDAFLSRPDVQAFVLAWANLWKVRPGEPILMQLNGVRGEQLVDPLQGDVLHLCDDRVFHSVDSLHQADPGKPYERFVVIINTRFVDEFQNRILRRHFPDAVLHAPR